MTDVAPQPSSSQHVADVSAASFPAAVIERSHEVPVVVDFWADWCGPCRTLGPLLETAIQARNGEVVLAKVDVDANQQLAQTYRVQGIPQVLGFRDGQVVGQFTGVLPADRIETFLDELLPTEADRCVARARALPGDAAETELRRALDLDPGHREASLGLAERIVERDPDEALALVRPLRPDPVAEAVVTRAELTATGGGDVDELRRRVEAGTADGAAHLDLGRALAARGDHAAAIDALLAAIELGGEVREPAREQLVALFGVLGDGDARVDAARPRLARALF